MSFENPVSITPEDRNLLMRLTAEMLAVSFRVCLRRDCRRACACRYRRVRSGEPPCLEHLGPDEHAAFEQLFRLVIKIADTIHIGTPARNADERALEEAAIEIVCLARRKRPQLGCFLFSVLLAKYRTAALDGAQGPERQTAANG